MDNFNEGGNKTLIGVCGICQRALYSNDELAESSPFIKCTECKKRELREKESQRQREEQERRYALETAKRKVKKTLIIPAVFMAVIVVIVCVLKPYLTALVIPSALLLYMTAVQILWLEDPVASIFMFFLKAPRFTFGVIFELSIDGFIFFILVKLALWLIGILLSIVCFLLGLSLSMVFALFAFPFKLYKAIKAPEEIEFLF